MDSGNSGSLQSSSGGDEEYDSHGPSNISTFLNSSPHFGSISSFPSPFSHHSPTTFFDAHSQTFNPNNFPDYNNNDLMNLPRSGIRSDPNFNNFGNLTPPATTAYNDSTTPPIKASVHQPNNVAKNPKKRSRASRRAPTTVLTTDTTNFRQMVQEFTGIPTSPFTGSPYTRRLDLFSTASSALRSSSGHLDNLGLLYTLRPPPQKSPLSSSPLLVGTTTVSSSTSDVGISKQAQNMFNMQNNDQIQSFVAAPLPSNFDELGIYGMVEQRPRKDHRFIQQNETMMMRLFDGNNPQQVTGAYKLNCSASSSSEKGFENVCSAAEGTVGSWTCPSG